MARPLRSKLVSIYGPIVGSTWPNSKKFLAKFSVPEALWNSFKYAGKPVKSIQMNKDMIEPLTKALELVIARGLASSIKSYDGCWNVRPVRGGTKPSNHSYGLAIDLNASENGLGKKPKMDPKVVACFKEAGFVWGGDWKRLDGMHFQYVTEK